MPDPVPKAPGQKRRRNVTVRPEKLAASHGRAPLLPGAELLTASTVGWWETVWASPMAAVWLPADVPALVRLALLMELSFLGEASAALLGEIRQLEDRFGLSPLARRRLQWEVDQAGGSGAAVAEPEDDGRWLRVVSG